MLPFQKNRTDSAIKIHETETQGESRSPILAAFQNIPRNLRKAESQSNALISKTRQSIPSLISVENARHESMNISTGAYHEQNDDKKSLEIKYRRLRNNADVSQNLPDCQNEDNFSTIPSRMI